MFLINLIFGLCKFGWGHDNYIKTRNMMDSDPTCKIKSDVWKRKNGLL